MKSKMITFRATDEFDRWLTEQANRCNLSKSEYIIKCMSNQPMQIIDKAAQLVQPLCRISSFINQFDFEQPEDSINKIEMEVKALWRLLK